MFFRRDNRNFKVLSWLVAGGITLFHCSGANGETISHDGRTTTEETVQYYTSNTVGLSDGTVIEEVVINGPPKPPAGFEAEREAVSLLELDGVSGIKTLTVPAFNWVFGCSAVSGAMIAGYYDRSGFPDMYTGPTNGGVMPLNNSSWPTWSDGYEKYPNCPLIASKKGVDGRTTKGSINDYWVKYGSTKDPYLTGGWTQHTWGSAIGDYMMTSQSAFGNGDGSTKFYNNNSAALLTCDTMESNSLYDGTLGRKRFYEARGYPVGDCYNQRTDNKVAGGFSFEQFKAEIDAGHPVLLNLKGHSVVGVGYDSVTDNVFIHDTWDYADHKMPWGGSYSGMELLSVSIVHIASQQELTVNIGGNKKGTINANGLTCSKYVCAGKYAYGTSVTITAKPASGSFLNGWTGCNSSFGNSCIVKMTAGKTVTVDFSPPPKISVSPLSLNFGKVGTGTPSAVKTILVKNKGVASLKIKSVSVEGDTSFTRANYCSVVSAGGSCPIYVTFTPASAGVKNGLIIIESNDPAKGKGEITVKLTGKGK